MSGDTMGRFSVKFLHNTNVEGRTVYGIQVTNPDGETWNIAKRYSEIRELHEELRLRHGDQLPPFPGKRYFFNQDPDFIVQRQRQLETYVEGALQIERDVRTPALVAFLGGPTRGSEKNQARQYQEILDNMQAKLLNLTLPPAPLDETEMAQRLKKYGQAMRLHVLSQPVDPIHLRAPGFDSEPLPLCSSNAEHLEALKSAPSNVAANARILDDLLDNLRPVLRPTEPIADPERLIVNFPPISPAS